MIGIEGVVFGQEQKYNMPFMRPKAELFDSGELGNRTEDRHGTTEPKGMLPKH